MYQSVINYANKQNIVVNYLLCYFAHLVNIFIQFFGNACAMIICSLLCLLCLICWPFYGGNNHTSYTYQHMDSEKYEKPITYRQSTYVNTQRCFCGGAIYSRPYCRFHFNSSARRYA